MSSLYTPLWGLLGVSLGCLGVYLLGIPLWGIPLVSLWGCVLGVSLWGVSMVCLWACLACLWAYLSWVGLRAYLLGCSLGCPLGGVELSIRDSLTCLWGGHTVRWSRLVWIIGSPPSAGVVVWGWGGGLETPCEPRFFNAFHKTPIPGGAK